MGTLVVKEKRELCPCPSASLMPCPTWRLLTVFVHVELPLYPCSLSLLQSLRALSQERLVMVCWALSDTAHPCILFIRDLASSSVLYGRRL